jgi:hypothetical protein
MLQRILAVLGWAGFAALLITAFVVQQPQRSMAVSLAWLWFIAAIAYALSLGSLRPTRELCKNAIVACVLLSVVSFVVHGAPILDHDGFTLVDGFDATFEQQSAAAVETFGNLFVASLVGVWIASAVRCTAREQLDLDAIEKRLVRVSAITVQRNEALFTSTDPADAEALLHLGEVLAVMTDAGQLLLELKATRGGVTAPSPNAG